MQCKWNAILLAQCVRLLFVRFLSQLFPQRTVPQNEPKAAIFCPISECARAQLRQTFLLKCEVDRLRPGPPIERLHRDCVCGVFGRGLCDVADSIGQTSAGRAHREGRIREGPLPALGSVPAQAPDPTLAVGNALACKGELGGSSGANEEVLALRCGPGLGCGWCWLPLCALANAAIFWGGVGCNFEGQLSSHILL